MTPQHSEDTPVLQGSEWPSLVGVIQLPDPNMLFYAQI